MYHRILALIAFAMMVFVMNLAYYYEVSDRIDATVTNSVELPKPAFVRPWYDWQSVTTIVVDGRDMECLTANIYYEARNQSVEGMAAVGYIVLNRVASRQYPDTICNVVYQGRKNHDGSYKRHQCQFSWVCDGKRKGISFANILEEQAWEHAYNVANAVLQGTIDNPIGDAVMYHANYVKPSWRSAYDIVATVDDHIFYEKRG